MERICMNCDWYTKGLCYATEEKPFSVKENDSCDYFAVENK